VGERARARARDARDDETAAATDTHRLDLLRALVRGAPQLDGRGSSRRRRARVRPRRRRVRGRVGARAAVGAVARDLVVQLREDRLRERVGGRRARARARLRGGNLREQRLDRRAVHVDEGV